MSRNRRNQNRAASSSPVDRPGSLAAGVDWLEAALLAVVGGVLVARWITPTEAASLGGTLWLALGALLACLLWAAVQYREGTLQCRLSWIDWGPGLLVLGNLVSAGLVLATTGDKRASLNLLWEWVGIAATWFLLRQLLVNEARRRQFLTLFLATGVSLSGLGVYQHFFGYSELIKTYDQLTHRLDDLEQRGRPANPRAAAEWDIEQRQLQGEFLQMGIPAEAGARFLWEQRLKASREPLGMFALANTLAGVLLCVVVVWLAAMIARGRGGLIRLRWRQIAGWGALLLVAFCLLLTKSRTAYVGLLAGLLAWGAALMWSRTLQPRKLIIGGLAILMMAVLGAGVAWGTGGLDRFVFSEAGKSLRYRLEYWSGTWQVINENSGNRTFGVGPGNFRAHYLRYKLPESSEEIADPHNLFLDVWVNGGYCSLAGLVLLCSAVVTVLLQRPPTDGLADGPTAGPGASDAVSDGTTGTGVRPTTSTGATVPTGAPQATPAGSAIGGAASNKTRPASQVPVPFLSDLWAATGAPGIGALTACLLIWLLTIDERALVLAAGGAAFIVCCGSVVDPSRILRLGMGAAAIGLLVHLLGAGGIAMPAVLQTVLLLVVLGWQPQSSDDERVLSSVSRLRMAGVVGVLLAVCLTCLLTGPRQVSRRENLIADGDRQLFDRGNARAAEALYLQAAGADPLSADPYLRLSQLAWQRWQMTSGAQQEKQFDQVIHWGRDAIKRNPGDITGYRLLGEFYLERFRKSAQPDDAVAAVGEFAQAISHYPNKAALQVQMAEALSAAGQTKAAAFAAQQALDLHEISRTAGHTDKLLPEEQVKRMQTLAEELNSSEEQ